jgi:hypothetical protein
MALNYSNIDLTNEEIGIPTEPANDPSSPEVEAEPLELPAEMGGSGEPSELDAASSEAQDHTDIPSTETLKKLADAIASIGAEPISTESTDAESTERKIPISLTHTTESTSRSNSLPRNRLAKGDKRRQRVKKAKDKAMEELEQQILNKKLEAVYEALMEEDERESLKGILSTEEERVSEVSVEDIEDSYPVLPINGEEEDEPDDRQILMEQFFDGDAKAAIDFSVEDMKKFVETMEKMEAEEGHVFKAAQRVHKGENICNVVKDYM